ncbi:MAG: hypothetical protein QW548_00695 [Candidatus Aenigmatarchaeota archaeon]
MSIGDSGKKTTRQMRKGQPGTPSAAESLREQIEAARRQDESPENLKKSLEKLQKELREYKNERKQLDKLNAKLEEELRKKDQQYKEKLYAEIEKWTTRDGRAKEVSKLLRERDELRKQHEEARSNLARLKDDYGRLKADYNTLLKQRDDLLLETSTESSVPADHETLKKELEEAQAAVRTYKEKVAYCESKIAEYEAQLRDASDVRSQMDSLAKKAVSAIKAARERLAVRREQAREAAATIASYDKTISGLKQQLSDAETAKSSAEQGYASLKHQLNEINDAKERLLKEADERHKGELGKVQQERDAYKANAEKYERQLKDLDTKYRSVLEKLAMLSREFGIPLPSALSKYVTVPTSELAGSEAGVVGDGHA